MLGVNSNSSSDTAQAVSDAVRGCWLGRLLSYVGRKILPKKPKDLAIRKEGKKSGDLLDN